MFKLQNMVIKLIKKPNCMACAIMENIIRDVLHNFSNIKLVIENTNKVNIEVPITEFIDENNNVIISLVGTKSKNTIIKIIEEYGFSKTL